MTEEELNQKINNIVSQTVSLILGHLMLKYSSGAASKVMTQLVTESGFSQRISLSVKDAIEKQLREADQDIFSIASGVKVNPVTGQREIAGFHQEPEEKKEDGK